MSLGINVMTYDVITVTTVPVACNVLVHPIDAKLFILVCEVAVVSFVEVDHGSRRVAGIVCIISRFTHNDKKGRAARYPEKYF